MKMEQQRLRIFKTAIAKNIHYLRNYQTLHSKFISADVCYHFYVKEQVREGEKNDYVKLNNELVSPAYYRTYMMNEYDRRNFRGRNFCGRNFCDSVPPKRCVLRNSFL